MPLVEALFKSGYSHVYLSIMNKMESQILLNIDLKKSHFQTVSPIPPAPGVDSYIESSRAPRTIKHETYGIELARIHPGEFITSISNGGSIERANVVFIPRHYYISKYEITQKQYYLVTGKATKHRASDSLPIDGLSFEAAMEFCSKLGHGYRLPTEHEWEYAARGCGERTGADSYDYYIYSGSNNIDDVAWYVENSEGRVHPIGLKKANEYGLYDMSGNVFEWCIVGNGKDKTKGVLRGGNYASIARDCRTTVVVRTNEIKGGFRIVYDPHQKNENVKRDGNSPTGGTMP
jgi:formylglycine-generating enzyme required for sulfatase activity